LGPVVADLADQPVRALAGRPTVLGLDQQPERAARGRDRVALVMASVLDHGGSAARERTVDGAVHGSRRCGHGAAPVAVLGDARQDCGLVAVRLAPPPRATADRDRAGLPVAALGVGRGDTLVY